MTFKTVFSAEYQLSHFKEPVYQILADTRLESGLTKGQTVARSYSSDLGPANDMGGDGSYSTEAIADTQETLVIDKEKEKSIYIKELDLLQAHLPLKQKYGRKIANALVNQIDADVLLTVYQGAGTSLDDGDFGGTAGNGLTATASNIATVFSVAMQKLRLNNTIYYNKRFSSAMKLEEMENMPVAVISPEILTYIELYLGGKDTLLGDQVSRNSYHGYFHGFELFLSNALVWTGSLALATNPTDGDTITINGVTLTFRATLGSTAGSIHIASTVDITRANLVEFLNAGGATTEAEDTDTGYVAVSTANRKKLKNMVWTNDNTGDVATVVSAGWGTVVVSETLTAAGNVWTPALQQLHMIFSLARQACSLVVQKKPSMTDNPVTGKVGRDYIGWTVYGSKVFTDQAPAIVELAVNASAFTSSPTTVN